MKKNYSQLFEKFKEIAKVKTKAEVLAELGISDRTYYYWRKKANISIDEAPKKPRNISKLIEHHKENFSFKEKSDYYYDNIPVTLPNEPCGFLLLGDPHLDNEGTDLEKFEKDIKVAKETDGVYAVGLGDYIDNWVGYLSKLYAKSSITEEDAYDLIKYYFSDIAWLALVVGNHDLFNNGLVYFLRQTVGDNVPLSEFIRLNVKFEGVEDNVTVHLRHQFNGKSQYNPAFSLVKQAIFNMPDDILAQGHTHQSGYTVWANPHKYLSHCLVVGSYKKVDSFGKKVSLFNQNHFPSVLVVINPALPKTNHDRIKVFFDIEQGAKYLEFLRGTKAS